MKKLVISLLFILVGLFIVDRLGGEAMWWVSQHTNDIAGPKIKYLVNDVDDAVVLLGTSRCNGHYVPSIISDTLGLSVYNGGIDASQDIFAHYIMLNHILAHHQPKMIVLDVSNNDLMGNSDFKTVGYFAPYFGKNSESDAVMREAGKYCSYKASHLYRYNSKAPSFILGLVINKNAENDHGYIPIPKPRSFTESLITETCKYRSVDSLKNNYLQRFVDRCREHNVELVFSISPRYSIVDTSYYALMNDFAYSNKVPIFDYHTAGLFLDCPECFRDRNHLWDSCARVFSSRFAQDLKLYLDNK